MYSTKDLYNKKLFVPNKKGKLKKHGHLRSAVFHPSKPQLVGFVLKRPDLLWMIRRPDRFIAADSIAVQDGMYTTSDKSGDAWDKAACSRLGIDLDSCIIWDGMPVINEDGVELGLISDVALDEDTFKIDHVDISGGAIDRALLGSADIPASDLLGYKDGAIVAKASVKSVDVAGGAAAKAGEAWAKGSNAAAEAGKKAVDKTTETAEKVVDKAADAINDGAFNAGKLIGEAKANFKESAGMAEPSSKGSGKPAAKKSSSAKKSSGSSAAKSAGKAIGKQANGWKNAFKEMKSEYDKASKGE